MNETNQNGGELELSREVEAIQIPSGDTFKLPAGTKVIITQSLGGTYTVATDQGLARISDKDSDALGIKEEKIDQPSTEKVNSGIDVKDEDFESAVWEQLKTVFDPEIPVNIYDLGLIYDINISKGNNVFIKMSLTSPGCPVAGELPKQVADELTKIKNIGLIEVELVWDPPWTKERMSEDAKLALDI